MHSPDRELRILEQLRKKFPGDEAIWNRWLSQRERMNLPIFSIRVYVEFWPHDDEWHTVDPIEVTLYRHNATLDKVVAEGIALRVDPNDGNGLGGWHTSWRDPHHLWDDAIVKDPESILSHLAEDHEISPGGLAAIAYAMDVTYLDGRRISDEDVDRISEGISEGLSHG